MNDGRDSGEFAFPPPTRWLDDADDENSASDLERSLLESGVDAEPPPDAQRQIWAGIALALGSGGGPGGSGGPPPTSPAAGSGPAATGAAAAKGGAAAAAAAGGGGLVTSAILGAVCAVAVLAGHAALEGRSPEPKPSPSAPAMVALPVAPRRAALPTPLAAEAANVPALEAPPPALASIAPRANDAPRSPPGVSANPSPAAGLTDAPLLPGDSALGDAVPAANGGGDFGAGGASVVSARMSRLREESQLLQQARASLHSGDAAGCFRILEVVRTRFPSGVLGQEREALTIEALATSGNRALAAERAAAFLRAYPSSPHAPRVRTFVQ